MNRIRLFFKEPFYRKMFWAKLKLQISDLPVIKQIFLVRFAIRYFIKSRNKSRWELYVEKKELEDRAQQVSFVGALLLLSACILNKEKDEIRFNETKEELLGNELINEVEHKDFKEWLEQIDFRETDDSRVMETLNKFIGKELGTKIN